MFIASAPVLSPIKNTQCLKFLLLTALLLSMGKFSIKH